MSLNILIIHNPVAGRRRRKRLRQLLKLLHGRGHHVRVKLTTYAGDAHETARDVDGFDVIIAAGGDGTVNEVVNGLCSRADDKDLPAVAFLPLGTANVLAWELHQPKKPGAVLEMIERGHTLEMHPGLANGRRFVLMASAGLDARAVSAVKTSMKRLLGGAAYVTAALKALGQERPLFTVRIGERAYEAATVVVTHARHYGGPFVITPEAGLDRPQMQVVMMRGHGWWNTLRYGAALVMGRLHRLADVEVVAATGAEIEGPDFDPVQMDGDLMSTLPLSVGMEPRAVRLCVP